MSLTRRIGHYARRGSPTGRVPGLRLPLSERTDSSESGSTAAWSMDSAPYQRTRGHHRGLNPSGPGSAQVHPGSARRRPPDPVWDTRAVTPCASCAASLRSRANPGKVRGPYPEDLAGSPGGGSVRPVSPGYLGQREALGSFGCRVAYHGHGSRSVGLREMAPSPPASPGWCRVLGSQARVPGP